ncbi:hypothetical protein BSKO_05508 [Bryopsis sp. KO-2023]|nr:hypothetical protein BSKO_05499 [Bryopsis sp. KO-2023]GMH37635.1 hypothetical protein BSKO_05508 [Bryopsis sp. KO-2023]
MAGRSLSLAFLLFVVLSGAARAELSSMEKEMVPRLHTAAIDTYSQKSFSVSTRATIYRYLYRRDNIFKVSGKGLLQDGAEVVVIGDKTWARREGEKSWTELDLDDEDSSDLLADLDIFENDANGGQVDAKAIAAAQAEVKNDIAEAVAKAVSIVESVATVVASAIANAFSSAKGGSSEATSAVKSSVSTSGIVTAAARARVVAESKGGSVEVTVSEAVTRVVAKAIANALAVVQEDSAVATAGVEATTGVKEQATVDSTSRVTGRGKFPEVLFFFF